MVSNSEDAMRAQTNIDENTRPGWPACPMMATSEVAGNCACARDLFAKNLRAWRTEMNLAMKVVAADIGVHESTYCLWESGKRFPSAENLDAIASYAKFPICTFFRDSGEA